MAFPAHALELEITEGLLLTDPAGATRTLADLRAMGIVIAVDDYGTGYSSLAYRRELPVDQLKIDRSFVTDLLAHPRNAAIVRSTIDVRATTSPSPCRPRRWCACTVCSASLRSLGVASTRGHARAGTRTRSSTSPRPGRTPSPWDPRTSSRTGCLSA